MTIVCIRVRERMRIISGSFEMQLAIPDNPNFSNVGSFQSNISFWQCSHNYIYIYIYLMHGTPQIYEPVTMHPVN